MFYFLNQYLFERNSGVEHAEIQRIKLFKLKGQPAQLITRDFDRHLHQTILRFGLTDADLLNQYDFFQEVADFKDTRELRIDALPFPLAYQIDADANGARVTNGDRLVAKVIYIPGTVGQIDQVQYFDPAGNLVQSDLYDWRGFKTAEQYFGQDGQLITEYFFRLDGTRVIEKNYVKDTQGNPLNTLISLREYHNHNFDFTSEDDFFAFFLDQVNRKNGLHNSFIADRPGMANAPLLAMTSPAKRYVFFPIAHAIDPKQQQTSPLDGFYQDALSPVGLTKLNGLITMTEQQRDDLEQRLNGQERVYAIPGNFIEPEQAKRERVLINTRMYHRLLFVGRIGPEKQLDQLIHAFELVHNGIPDATLEIRGYGDPNTTDQLKQLVSGLNLVDSVHFTDYTPDLTAVYDNAQVFALTSQVDAEPLAMIEAQIHGLPLVSYNFNYGPQTLIDDGTNGYLVAPGKVFALANRIMELFRDPTKLQNFSTAAYASSQRYTADAVWAKWKQLIDENQ
jgi:poly(glycerol-phosphate) alpha-glucosyltransferase